MYLRLLFITVFILNSGVCFPEPAVPEQSDTTATEEAGSEEIGADSTGQELTSPWQHAASDDEDDQEDELEISETIVDGTQRALSEYIIALSDTIDEFFGGDRNLESSKGSYGCISVDFALIERGETENKVSGCLKLVLPNTKERFKLIVSGATEEEQLDRDNPQAGTETLENLESEESSLSAALRYVSEYSLLKDISWDIGIKGGTPMDPFTRVRYRKTWVPQVWLYRFTESVYYFRSLAGGVLTRFDFERPYFNKKLYSRITSEADFRDEDNQFYLKQGFSLFQRLDRNRAIDYELIYYGETQPSTHLDRYLVRMRLRERLYKKWLFLELTPQVDFERENDFSAVSSFTISFEALFGKLK